MIRFLKLLLALLLLPTAFFAALETVHLYFDVLGNYKSAANFILGASIYAGIHYTVYDFPQVYVFMHEMTHALVALLFGSRVKDISVGTDSGYVKMDKTNMFIVLAPYVIPGYTILVVFGYMIAGLFTDMMPYRQWFLFGVGFFTSFHLIQTVDTILEADQPDLNMAGGKIFSIVVIVLANLVVLALVLKGLFPEKVALKQSVMDVMSNTVSTWKFLINYIGAHAQAWIK